MLEMLFKIEKNDMAFYSGSIANVKCWIAKSDPTLTKVQSGCLQK